MEEEEEGGKQKNNKKNKGEVKQMIHWSQHTFERGSSFASMKMKELKKAEKEGKKERRSRKQLVHQTTTACRGLDWVRERDGQRIRKNTRDAYTRFRKGKGGRQKQRQGKRARTHTEGPFTPLRAPEHCQN